METNQGETYEGLLSAYLEKTFQELQHGAPGTGMPACAQLAAQLILSGAEEALWVARLRLGLCQPLEN